MATDGYTTLTDIADFLQIGPSLTVANGVFSNYAVYAFDLSAPADPYYGYTVFSAGGSPEGGSTQLNDVNDPQIVGLDYAGHHIPVANGNAGYWTYPSVSAIPEPTTYGLMATGLVLLGFDLRRRRRKQTHYKNHSPGCSCVSP